MLISMKGAITGEDFTSISETHRGLVILPRRRRRRRHRDGIGIARSHYFLFVCPSGVQSQRQKKVVCSAGDGKPRQQYVTHEETVTMSRNELTRSFRGRGNENARRTAALGVAGEQRHKVHLIEKAFGKTVGFARHKAEPLPSAGRPQGHKEAPSQR